MKCCAPCAGSGTDPRYARHGFENACLCLHCGGHPLTPENEEDTAELRRFEERLAEAEARRADRRAHEMLGSLSHAQCVSLKGFLTRWNERRTATA